MNARRDLHRTVDLGDHDSPDEVEAAAVEAAVAGEFDEARCLFVLAGEAHMEDGDPGRGVSLFRRALELAEEHLGADDEDTLVVRGFLGRALTEASLFLEAEEVLTELLVDRDRLLEIGRAHV